MILDAAAPQQIPNMAEDGMMKVLAGITTIEELERVVDLQNTRSLKIKAPVSDSEAMRDEEVDISKYTV